MTPSLLQDALVRELERLFADKMFKNDSGELKKVNVFSQNVPRDVYGGGNDGVFPYILINISEFEYNEDANCKIFIVVGIYNDDEKLQGHKDLMNIMQDIIMEFNEKTIIGHYFTLIKPIKGVIDDEDHYPYFFGVLETNWELPNIE